MDVPLWVALPLQIILIFINAFFACAEIAVISLNENKLKCAVVGRGLAWIDTGEPSGLNDASNFVRTIQDSQSAYIACLEEVAYNQGFINYQQLINLGKTYKSEYGKYILSLKEKN